MFAVGDKIVCIKNDSYNTPLILGGMYTIKYVDLKNRIPYVCFEERGIKYTLSRFIPLVEYRKMQILKIKERCSK